MTMLEGLTSLTFDELPHTFMKDIKRRFVDREGKISHSIISENADCQGTIENSIIYPNAVIDSQSTILNSIILPGAKIMGRSKVYNSIIKKDELVRNAEVIENWQ
jgi:ADP-glucose pyrophosphorylase